MLTTLYAPFRKWSESGTIWIISDPHLSDPEMVHLRKNYIGDEEQIKRINSKVGKKDTLIILGDVGNVEWVKKLRGYKVLVMGNHDSGATNYLRQKSLFMETADFDLVKYAKERGRIDYISRSEDVSGYPVFSGWIDNQLFDEVYEGPLFISEKILLSHEPIQLPFAFNIHGHDHSNWSDSLKGFQHLNVCAEHIDYTPVNLTALIKKGIASKVETIHRATIDHATERKQKREKAGKPKSWNEGFAFVKPRFTCEYTGRLCEHATLTGGCLNVAATCKPKPLSNS